MASSSIRLSPSRSSRIFDSVVLPEQLEPTMAIFFRGTVFKGTVFKGTVILIRSGLKGAHHSRILAGENQHNIVDQLSYFRLAVIATADDADTLNRDQQQVRQLICFKL